MPPYHESKAIWVSLIIGVILSFLFDGIFILFLMGFLSVYIVVDESKDMFFGIKTALIYGILNFFIRALMPVAMPSYIGDIAFDFFNALIGFIIVCLLSVALGGIGGFFASKTSDYVNDRKRL